MIFYATFIAPVLAFWLWAPVLSLSWRARAWAVLATTLLGLLPVGLILIYRRAWFSEAAVVHAQVFSGWVMGVLLLMVPLLLLRDVGWLGLRLLRRERPVNRSRATAWLLTLAGVVSAWGVYGGLRVPEVREQEVVLDQLPAELDGLRVAVLADIHATPVKHERHVQALVDRTNAARPDLIVLPGDMADGDATLGARHVAPLAQLRAPHGVWAAPGNHEYYNGYDAWTDVFQTLNLTYLENQSVTIDIRGKRVAISGVGDPAYGRLSAGNRNPLVAEGLPPDIDAVVQQATGSDLHLLLAHQPKLARVNAGKGLSGGPQQQVRAEAAANGTTSAASGKAVDLQISGHTHGGHVLGMDRWLVAPANDGFVRGLYRVGGMQLFVSNGAGLWVGFPLRLGVPASIDLLVLRAGRPARV
ncbi:metallophosphatase [Comamonas serinivorans]|uniref:Metallophosphatase n=1 Tax=Comamonas serinivorans TaxID=1082851 RepID=A0A1Y0EQD1_9BURK|nr:metallophosphoesterase [Comamonas serinivorans]ARU05864.1 metallophosphatase [Comamonas serinivorans]